MGIVLRQSILTAASSYMGAAIGFLTTFWLYPLVFNNAEIGFLQTIEELTVFIAMISVLGFSATGVRFVKATEGNLLAKKTFWSLIFGICIGLFSIIWASDSLFHWLRASYTDEPLFVKYELLIFPIGGTVVLFNLLEMVARANLYASISVFLRELVKRFLLLCSILLFYFNYISFSSFLWSWWWAHLSIALILCVSVWKKNYLLLGRIIPSRLSPELRHEAGIYTLYYSVGILGSVLFARVNTLAVSAIQGFSYSAAYGMAFKMLLPLELLRGALLQVLYPALVAAFHKKDMEEVKNLYQKSSINLQIGGTLSYLLLLVNLPTIFACIPNSDRFSAAENYLIILGIGRLIDMSFGANAELLASSSFYKRDILYYFVIAIFSSILTLIMIHFYQGIGAAIAWTVSIISFNIVRCFYIYRQLNLLPFSKNNLYVLLLGIGLLLIQFIIPIQSSNLWTSISDLILRSGLITLIFMGCILYFNISSDMTSLFRKFKF